MTAKITSTEPISKIGEPTWEIAHEFPLQGDWTEEDFFALQSPHRYELNDGKLEILPMPNWIHQLIALFLIDRLREYLKINNLGRAAIAPFYVRLAPKKIRQPDVVFVRHERILSDLRQTQNGADLVMEVVSPGETNSERDWIEKRKYYAEAGIAEYWVVDPEQKVITVFTLDETGMYQIAGEYREGLAASKWLPGFTVDVAACFKAGECESS